MPTRVAVGVMAWLGFINLYISRVNLSVIIVAMVVGGRLAERYGAKWLIGVSILSGGVANLLTPTAARLHYGVLIALNF
ncbi:hypothetical protein Pcinc_005100 [Petrolisthes cinctipes]|uniref:MFS transporter n=1 Tax=Petrolisthes cinctipes TaxID=88211 RepID=A0AAE1L0F2_PETCI|nr:hypothetical protein Pcinc_005100 [Petrolisthes cinctipes]